MLDKEQCKHLMNPETCISCEDETETEKREKELMKEEIVKKGNDLYVKKEKRYYADIKITWGVSFNAKNKEEAIQYLKEQYKDDYGIDLHDDEIIKLEEE